MCLAIPGKIVEFTDEENQIAQVEVGGVRRHINIGMLDRDELQVGDYVLIHVGFAMSKVNEKEAEATLRLLQDLGSYETEIAQFESSTE